MSVKERVNSIVSDQRKSINKTPILEPSDPTPPVKTAVGISYSVLSDQITAIAASAQKNGGVIVSSDVQKLLDSLYAAPRLNQWHDMNGYEFRLYTTNDAMFVSVSADRIFLTKGIREFVVFQGMAATALYNTLAQAQALVQPAIAKPVMTDAEQEEYFAPDDINGADIDSALADSSAGEAMPSFDTEETASLMEDIEAPVEESMPIDKETPDLEEVFAQKPYTERKNSQNSKTDGVICGYCGNLNQQAYRGPCPQCPKEKAHIGGQTRVETYSSPFVLAQLKSLQGQVLNVVEAAIADKEQRKAVKTLINKTFRSKMNNFGLSDEE